MCDYDDLISFQCLWAEHEGYIIIIMHVYRTIKLVVFYMLTEEEAFGEDRNILGPFAVVIFCRCCCR